MVLESLIEENGPVGGVEFLTSDGGSDKGGTNCGVEMRPLEGGGSGGKFLDK